MKIFISLWYWLSQLQRCLCLFIHLKLDEVAAECPNP